MSKVMFKTVADIPETLKRLTEDVKEWPKGSENDLRNSAFICRWIWKTDGQPSHIELRGEQFSEHQWQEAKHTVEVAKATEAEWVEGELPAIGCKCEASWVAPPDGGGETFVKGVFKGGYGSKVWFGTDEYQEIVVPAHTIIFRPIKTALDLKVEREAEGRLNSIADLYEIGTGELLQVDSEMNDDVAYSVCELLFDAGCRLTKGSAE